MSFPDSLLTILAQAMLPCPQLINGPCTGACRWEPGSGFIPRGYVGASEGTEFVQLILVTSEPAMPGDDEHYSGTPEDMALAACTYFRRCLEGDTLRRNGQPAPFHRALRRILDHFFPNYSLDQQLKFTWITNAVLCSNPVRHGRETQHGVSVQQ